MFRSCFCADALVALVPVLAVALFAVAAWWFAALGFGLLAAVLLGALAFCAFGVLVALTAPLWGLALGLLYIAGLVLLTPFYHLATQCFRTHKAS
ncbi:hypothetical protein [uncultured Fretibacterium sp.]|jgi:hypothetical protein|uniref:hypothetical protein n=1 Tax=uncultured Fretibacterium sp. TaxID=1678694 RepID=UPI00262E522C|nr:hypothetical protein [uncultured Fretibacterium sp.]